MEALIYGIIFTIISGFGYTYAIRLIIKDLKDGDDKDREN